MTSNKQNHSSENRVPVKQLIVFGAGGLIPIALFNIAGQLVGLIGNISLGLSAFWLGAILIVPRLWDAISDPIIGHLSDNTRTRFGRRRPFVLAGGISVALSFMMLWWVPKHESVMSWFPTESGFQWFQLSYILVSLLIFFTATNLFEIPHGALGMEMTPNSHDRTKLFSAKSFFGNLFAMATPWLFALAGMEIFKGPGGTEADGMRYVSIVVAIFLVPISFWWFFSLQEPAVVEVKNKQTEKRSHFWADMKYIIGNRNFIYLVVTVFTLAMGFNFVSLLNYYISIFYIYGGDKSAAGPLLGINGTIWAVTGLLAVFPLNWLSPKIGKRETLILSIGLMCAAQVAKIFCYNPTYPYLVIIPTILLSAGMLFFFTLSSSMLGDVCDEDDLKTGKRSEGAYYSVFWWFIKMGSAFASLITGLLILFTQFDETQVTRVDELRGSVNELRTEAAAWKNHDQGVSKTKEALETQLAGLQKEAKTLTDQLNHSTLLYADFASELEEINNRNKTRNESLNGLKTEVQNLHPTDSADAVKRSADKLMAHSLSLKADRASLKAWSLKRHLAKETKKDADDEAHGEMLVRNVEVVRSEVANLIPQFSNLNATQPIEVTLPTTDAALHQLTQQTPKSLLMMRIIEISLPILLSLISLLFALKYPLTSQRILEIQEALKKRNQA